MQKMSYEELNTTSGGVFPMPGPNIRRPGQGSDIVFPDFCFPDIGFPRPRPPIAYPCYGDFL